tara:strand:+ start:3179 stop:4045 length:867 start_codon:yes stop_codon:yes gene_type:complete
MGLTITSSSYAGSQAGAYLHAALRGADSLEYATVRDAVNYKEVLNTLTNSNLVKDATCGFDEQSSTLTMTENVLEVEQFQINQDICRKTLLSDWSYAQEDDFVAFAMAYSAGVIADGIEGAFWAGTTGTSGQFNGITTSYSGSMTTDSASGAYTAANIVANIGSLVAAIPAAVYMKDDLYIYMNKKAYRFYISAISALSAFPFNHMGQYTPEFEGIKIAVVSGLADNVMYAGTKGNLFFGTSTALDMDFNEVKVLDMADLDGSQNVRLVARWTAGVQVGVAADFTYQS